MAQRNESGVFGLALMLASTSAYAQAEPPKSGELPALPSTAPAPDPGPPAPAPPTTLEPAPAPQGPVPAAPPAYAYEPAPAPTHAPRNAFWVGAQLGAIGYGGSFFINRQNREETTGNLVGEGVALEVDVGARLQRRYMPYVFGEFAALTHGNRFDSDARTSSRLLGLGFRFIIGNVDKAGFLADLSLAQRQIKIEAGGQEFTMTSPEIFRLGLGAEIRLSNIITLSPIVHLSGGSMEDSKGTIAYAQPQADGETGPSFQRDEQIGAAQRSYLVVGIGCGGHFDLFGK